jgi:hypothetical protein
MERREFIQHSVLVAGAVVVGLPMLNFDRALANLQAEKPNIVLRSRLYGSTKTGCARYIVQPETPDSLLR